MDKKLKELIAKKKLSDEQLLHLIESYESESQSDLEDSGTSEESSDGTDDRDAFTKEELEAWIDAKVEARLKALPKPQPNLKPALENKQRPPQYKKLVLK